MGGHNTAQKRVPLSTGVELDVWIEGDPRNPPLIFLHGFPESHRTWRHQIAHFSDRYFCIAPDQRGYRGSSCPQEVEAYTPDKLTADIFALADALGLHKFTIVGHDWGGAIAWSVALNGQPMAMNPIWAGRVTRVIIANAPHPFIFQQLLLCDKEQRAASQYIRDFRNTDNDALVRESGLTGLLAKVVKWERPSAMEPAERDALLTDWKRPETVIGMLNWYRASTLQVPSMDEPFQERGSAKVAFPVLTTPTLVIWAMDDLALPGSNLDGLEELCSHVQIERVHGCGHFVPWEAPGAVNAAMGKFLGA